MAKGCEHIHRHEPVTSDCRNTCHMSATETGATAPVTNIASGLLPRQLCSHYTTHHSTPRVSDSASKIQAAVTIEDPSNDAGTALHEQALANGNTLFQFCPNHAGKVVHTRLI